ncbi:MAG TPA: IgGFc-binding protein, partial [Candidatus Kapabacteria bacterium]|nr:IgGFc-binding protein [Candidatus Kapabacteria bacterium]
MRITLLACILLTITTASAFSQAGISSDGREYYIGMMQPSFLTTTNPDVSKYVSFQRVALMITSLVQTDVAISYFESNGKEDIPTIYHISPSKPKQIPLDVSKINSVRPGETAGYNTCHVVSQAPISIQFNSVGPFSGGAYQPLPLQCLGKKYVVMSYHDNPLGYGGIIDVEKNPKSTGFFIIIAPYDNTIVQITPTSTTASGNPGVQCGAGATHIPKPFSVPLYKGQSYVVESAASEATCDISGTTIESTSPIIVLAGHENANTDGSQILGTLDETDWRDYMIEQLLPVECFDTTGYYTIPSQDASDPTASGGEGDEIRAFCNGASASTIQLVTASNTVTDFSCSPLQIPGPHKLNLTVPAALHSVNGVPFSVMMYDQRSEGKSGTSPAPSMTSIIPRSLWKSEYFWSIVYQPTSKQNPFYRQDSYLNIICRKEDYYNGNLKISYAGNPITDLLHCGLVVKHTWNSIPASSDLIGLTLSTDDGNFHILNTALNIEDSTIVPFAAYISGRGLFDPNNRPNDPPGNATVGYSYSQPLGMVYKAFGTRRPTLSTSIIDNCDNWSICLKDSGGEGNGIRYIELINYESNTIVPKPEISRSVSFDKEVDPLGKGEIVLDSLPMQCCFKVIKQNNPDSSRAVIAVYDNSGDLFMIDLSGKVRPALSASASLTTVKDSIFEFTSPHIDSQVCGTIVLKNSAPAGPVDLVVSDMIIPKSASFIFTSTLPKFPITLQKSDSLVLS